MALCKFTDFIFRHMPENPQLRRMGDEILGAYQKSLPDLGRESWQIVVHLCLAINRAIRVRTLFLQRQRWWPLGFTVESCP